MIFSIIANVRRKKDITVGNRRIDSANVHQAYGLLSMYLALAIIGCGIICIVAPEYSLADVVFEVVSALSTVGYSVGLSVHVAVVGKVVLILLMYIGRVGMLSFAMIFAGKNKVVPLERPTEKIIIG
ncbi:ktrB [Acidaminococcus sp. CAG:917]|nr:ktrB [Acidaminococcus sp. CAG:917]